MLVLVKMFLVFLCLPMCLLGDLLVVTIMGPFAGVF